MSWDKRFAEPIVLDDGTKLATLREALAHLAEIITKAERNLPEILTASAIVTKAAEQRGPVEFARSINRVRSLAQRHEMRTSQAGARPMTDREAAENAVTASGPAATTKTAPSMIKRHAPRRTRLAAPYPIHSKLDCSGLWCERQFVLMIGIGW